VPLSRSMSSESEALTSAPPRGAEEGGRRRERCVSLEFSLSEWAEQACTAASASAFFPDVRPRLRAFRGLGVCGSSEPSPERRDEKSGSLI